jgi:serine/threonine protein kinase
MGCEQSAPIVDNDNPIKPNNENNICCGTHPKPEFTYRKGICALEYWEPLRLIGEGSISSIHLVRRRPERIDVPYKERADVMRLAEHTVVPDENYGEDVYALKSIMKDHIRNNRFLEEMRSEIYTMSRLCHPNIVNVIEAFERKRHIYLIMEYCRGGDLNERKFSEAEAAVIVRKILSAVAYLHEHNVVHRDLKMENIVFDKDPKDPTAATKFLSNEYKQMTARVGTLYSMAPQVLQGVYDAKCDM